MKKRKVWKYFCEYCGKGNCNPSYLSRHERHCTLNPNRECRMCALVGNTPLPIEALQVGIVATEGNEEGTAGSAIITGLRTLASGCPACILAALRQYDSGNWFAKDFDFKKEGKAWIDDWRDAHIQHYPSTDPSDATFDRETWLEKHPAYPPQQFTNPQAAETRDARDALTAMVRACNAHILQQLKLSVSPPI